MANKLKPAEGSAPATRQEAQRSLALPVILQQLQDDRKHTILDLGPSLSGNIRFLAAYRVKLYIESLSLAVEALTPASEEDEVPSIAPHVQHYPDETRFDLVFAWDLFDYLPLATLRALLQHLSPYCTQDTRLLALISNSRDIPASPTQFHLLDEHTLTYANSSVDRRPCPMHSQMALRKRLPELAVQRTYLLRNGMQEYIFRFRTD